MFAFFWGENMCSPENVAEEPLELLPEDAVDYEVDGGV